MSNLTVDLDRLAREFDAQLDSATAHIIAATVPGVELNHVNGIMLAARVLNVSQFVLDNLTDADYHNRERFKSFSDRADKQVRKFWQTFNLFLITRANGNTAAVQANPAPDKHPGVIFRHPRLSDTKDKMIRDLLAMCGPKVTTKDMKAIAEQVGVGVSSVYTRYHGNK